MTFSTTLISILFALSLVIVAVAVYWPVSPQTGTYDFVPAFDTIAHILWGLVAIVVLWVSGFIVLAIWGH